MGWGFLRRPHNLKKKLSSFLLWNQIIFLKNIYVGIFITNLNLKLEYCLRDKVWTWTGVKADSSQNNSGYGVKRRLHSHKDRFMKCIIGLNSNLNPIWGQHDPIGRVFLPWGPTRPNSTQILDLKFGSNPKNGLGLPAYRLTFGDWAWKPYDQKYEVPPIVPKAIGGCMTNIEARKCWKDVLQSVWVQNDKFKIMITVRSSYIRKHSW